MTMLATILTRDIALAFRRGGGALMGLVFFAAIFTLFAFGLGPDVLKTHAQAVLAASLLLSVQLFMPYSLERDAEDGTLEYLLLLPVAQEWLLVTRMFAAWVAQAVPLLVISPLLLLMAGTATIGLNLLALLLSSLTLTAIGYISACLLLGLRARGGAHILITLPFSITPLIFAALPEQGGAIPMLAILSLISIPLSAWLSALLIRWSME